jgi:hypothetical protein
VSKQKPFTRKQRSNLRKKEARQLAADGREARWEQKEWELETLPAFKGCDPDRTEALADAER